MDVSKTKWSFIGLLVLLGLVLIVPLAIFFCVPGTSTGVLKVTLLSITNDSAGRSLALLSVTNGSERLFVRGHSEIEVQGNPSNKVEVVQISKVDYLNPGQSIVFSVPSPSAGHAWRINFKYFGRLSFLERLKEGIAWLLYNCGFPVSEKQLRLTPVRDISSGWIDT